MDYAQLIKGEVKNMDLKALREALKAGKITLAQFKEQAKAYLASQLASGGIDQAEYDSQLSAVESEQEDGGGGAGGGGSTGGMTEEDIKKLIQSEADKVRTEYAKKLRDREDELEKIKREKMTDEERAKADLDKAQKDLADKEAELQAREVALHTFDQLKTKELPLDFKEFVTGKTIEETDALIEKFSGLWAKGLKEAVDKRFKEGGREPQGGKGGATGTVNPWKKETLNLTKQAEILKSDPALAQQLIAAAKG